MLSGLRSRWTMPASWARARARATCMRMRAVSSAERRRLRSSLCASDSPSSSSIDDVRRAVVDAVIENLHDVRAAKRGGRARFADEARDRLGFGRDARLDELDGNERMQREMLGHPNRPHASAAERLPQEVFSSEDPLSRVRLRHPQALAARSGTDKVSGQRPAHLLVTWSPSLPVGP